MIHKQIYSRWTSVNTIPAASIEVIQKDVFYEKKKVIFSEDNTFLVAAARAKKKKRGGGAF